MRSIFFFFLVLPYFCFCQATAKVTYEEARDNCLRIAKEANDTTASGKPALTNPDCMIGASIPEFTAYLSDGKEITPEYFKGKISVINFWYTSCAPCIAEIPGLNAIVEKYGETNVNFIGIAIDSDADVQDFLRNYPWSFDQVKDGSVLIFDVFKMWWGFPTTFVLNRDAQIISAFNGLKSDEIQVTLTSIIDKELH
ncbi:MAG TPA: TlpA disulfide reductase family protein [Saprospiraceae bacterium]|nr:TlpA disulfide reductase family protein [Saprospiraceae bacterium]